MRIIGKRTRQHILECSRMWNVRARARARPYEAIRSNHPPRTLLSRLASTSMGSNKRGPTISSVSATPAPALLARPTGRKSTSGRLLWCTPVGEVEVVVVTVVGVLSKWPWLTMMVSGATSSCIARCFAPCMPLRMRLEERVATDFPAAAPPAPP